MLTILQAGSRQADHPLSNSCRQLPGSLPSSESVEIPDSADNNRTFVRKPPRCTLKRGKARACNKSVPLYWEVLQNSPDWPAPHVCGQGAFWHPCRHRGSQDESMQDRSWYHVPLPGLPGGNVLHDHDVRISGKGKVSNLQSGHKTPVH